MVVLETTVGGFGWCSKVSLDCKGCIIYGLDGIVTRMVLWRLENQKSVNILMDKILISPLLKKHLKILKVHDKKDK